MELTYWINDFPLPPSANKHLIPISTGKIKYSKSGKPYTTTRMMKSGAHREFMNEVHIWALKHRSAVQDMKTTYGTYRKLCRSEGRKFALRIECFFAFSDEQMWSNREAPDADNRLKPCLDGLKNVLEIDDVMFFVTLSEKVMTPRKDQTCTVIRISPMKPRTLEDVRALMFQEATTDTSSSSSGKGTRS